MKTKRKMDYDDVPHYSEKELSEMDTPSLIKAYCFLQDSFECLRDKELPSLEEKYKISLVRQFGRSTEKSAVIAGKKPGSDEPAAPDDPTDPDDPAEKKDEAHRVLSSDNPEKERKRPVRKKGCQDKVTADLPVIDEQIKLTPEELKEFFGEDVSYKDNPALEKTFDVVCTVPVEHYIKRYHIHVYTGGGKILAASQVRKMQKNSIMSPDLLAEIVKDRCVLQLPMHRIAQDYARNGFRLTRQTMARWCIDIGTKYIAPVILRMIDLIILKGYMHADETFMTIGRTLSGKREECRQWVFRTTTLSEGDQIIVFWFDETRSTEVLRELFGKAQNLTIICDAYISYKTFAKERQGDIVIANCYTHGRRNFVDIIKTIPGFTRLSEEEKDEYLSYRIIKKINLIFENERLFKGLESPERLKRRQEESTPLVDDLFDTLNSIPEKDFDKSSALYDAVNYMKNQEENFRVFLNDGNVAVHNSSCEQAIIPFALGRNNWKCIDSIDGAITLGYYHSLTETAKANGANPFYYLKFLFERLPDLFKKYGGKPAPEYFDDFMPWTESYKTYERTEVEALAKNLKTWKQVS